ncbi:MAG TPA: hypothetical protein VFG83_14935 [Kofleriaceae bacterium]|nr:hypothetical protein [Kofleriaceae bacterium]
MTKLFTFVFAVALCVGCGSGSDQGTATEPDPTAAPTDQEPAVADDLAPVDATLTAAKVAEVAGDEGAVDDLPTAEDFEDEAATEITDKNLEKSIAAMEAELGK